MLTQLVKKKGKIESGEREPGQWPGPLALPLAPSRVESLSLSLSKEKEKETKPGGVPPEGDEPTGHKDESQ